jgi:hypothetical protein
MREMDGTPVFAFFVRVRPCRSSTVRMYDSAYSYLGGREMGAGGTDASMGESSSEEGAMGSGGGMAFFALDVTARGLNDM